MRTTVTIDDDLYRAIKVTAARSGETVGSVIEDALRHYLARSERSASAVLPALPAVNTGGARTGGNLDGMSSVYEILDEGVRLDALR